MAGDIITLKNSEQKNSLITSYGGRPTQGITGAKSSIFFNEALEGEPRHEDLFAVRLLGRTGYIEMAKDIIKDQVASTDFKVKPVIPENEDREPTDREMEAAAEMTRFFKGNFNSDDESFDHLLKAVLNDTLDFNSGCLELVPDQDGFLKEIIVRDGLTFTKNVKDNGKLPPPGEDEPAYYQFSLSAHAKQYFKQERQGIDLRNIRDELHQFGFTDLFSRETKSFGRSQVAWFEMDGRSENPYGRGLTQKVKKQAEHLINGDIHRNRFFLDNEYHKGFIKLDNSDAQQIKEDLEQKFKDGAGNEWEMTVIGSESAEYVNIDPTPEKMQFLESHKFFNKLALSIYGLNADEAGFTENSNRSVGREQRKRVFDQTTEPFLKMSGRVFTNQVLPFMREYNAVDIDFEFEFEPQNHFLKRLENEVISEEQDNGTLTLNEARRKKGLEDYGPVGDLPLEAFQSLAQRKPGYVAQKINPELDDVPSSNDDPLAGLLGSNFSNNDKKNKEKNDGDTVETEKEEIKGGSSGSTTTEKKLIKSYSDAYQHKDVIISNCKDALRNQTGFKDVPGLVEKVAEMQEDVGKVLRNSIDLEQELENEFPEKDQDQYVLADVEKVLENLDFKSRLASELETNNLDVLEMSAEYHGNQLENEVENRLTIPSETKVSVDFDLMDTFTAELVRQEAFKHATEIESSVRNQLKTQLLDGMEKGEGIDKIKNRVSKTVDRISSNHAELVARTETLQTSRKGSQALAESTDLIGGKEWIATSDNRTRDWHRVMDGEIVPKNDLFTVPQTGSDKQPNNYPRSARVVGEDQPFNCRCSQAPVLSEDMPDSVEQLSTGFENVNVNLGITRRQFEVWKEHGENEESFEQFWTNTVEEKSKSEIAEKFGMSKTTVYKWCD